MSPKETASPGPIAAARPAALEYVLEGAVPLVAEEQDRLRVEDVGMAVAPHLLLQVAADLVVRQREIDVVDHQQVEIAVVVDVREGRRGAPEGIGDAGLGGDVGEGAVAIVAEELIAAEAGDEEVEVAVAVDVAGRAAAAVGVSWMPDFSVQSVKWPLPSLRKRRERAGSPV